MEVGSRIRLPQDFAKLLYPLLVQGTTLLVTDAPMLEENTGHSMTVMGAGNPNFTKDETQHRTKAAGQS